MAHARQRICAGAHATTQPPELAVDERGRDHPRDPARRRGLPASTPNPARRAGEDLGARRAARRSECGHRGHAARIPGRDRVHRAAGGRARAGRRERGLRRRGGDRHGGSRGRSPRTRRDPRRAGRSARSALPAPEREPLRSGDRAGRRLVERDAARKTRATLSFPRAQPAHRRVGRRGDCRAGAGALRCAVHRPLGA